MKITNLQDGLEFSKELTRMKYDLQYVYATAKGFREVGEWMEEQIARVDEQNKKLEEEMLAYYGVGG